MRLFVVNVGVNSADAASRNMRSPAFLDGSFEFVPIKETARLGSQVGVPTYEDLRCWTGRRSSLAEFLPERVRAYRAHNDPEFETWTYGDVASPRAAALRGVVAGDQLWFLARLWNHDGVAWTQEGRFYFVGLFQVEHNYLIPEGSSPHTLPTEVLHRIAGNAHYKRLLAGDRTAFRVITGNPARSARFARAMSVNEEVVGHVYGGVWDPTDRCYRRDGVTLRNKNGKPRTFEAFGSVTRSIQSFLDSTVPEHSEHLRALIMLADAAGRAV